MEKKISSFLNMVSNVIVLLNKEKSQWDSISILDDTLERISEEYLSAMGRFKESGGMQAHGGTHDKVMLFENLTEHAFNLAVKLSSHAQLEKDDDLLSKVNFTLGTLQAGSEYQVLERCYTIASEAKIRLQKLDAATSLKKDINRVDADIERIKKIPPQLFNENISDHPERKNLFIAITQLRSLLDSVDDMVDCMIHDPEFRRKYHEIRKIVDPGHGTLKEETEEAEK